MKHWISKRYPSHTRAGLAGPIIALLAVAVCLLAPAWAEAKTVTADVVIMDHVLVFNRLGAQNVNGMIYALKRDVVDLNGVPLTQGGAAVPGQVTLRPDKRPRPLVLRVSTGDTLVVNFTNLLTPASNPFPPLPAEANPCVGCDAANPLAVLDNQVAGRRASFYVQGMELVPGSDRPVYVGNGPDNLATPAGGTATYIYYAEKEGTFLVTSMGVTFGGEGSGGNVSVGAMGAVNVEPLNARYYRSQVTEEELRLSLDTASPNSCAGTPGYTCSGHPIINYEATYPSDCPGGVWCLEGKAGLPILNMLTATNEEVHADVNAIVAGPNANGSFPPNTYPLESAGLRNPTVPNRLEPFREFTVVFHDEVAAANAFPAWYRKDINPVIAHTTHSVRDSFMINYGSGGIGSEIIANRLGVGPMWDCLDCAYEEFFLSAFTVGDPAMLVDVPSNTGLENCGPDLNPADCAAVGPKATVAFYPDDPSNVHHSYTSDFVKFRNLHAGPKEQHIFHLHNHQWLFNANDDNSNYLDAQGVGPGSGYTYEINLGGSGNRNKTAGDAIFHCHFYPHFAQGMWELWRIHDTLEAGTELAVSAGGIHTVPFGLKDGTPAAGARALPDGEIIAGTPIPAVVPMPGLPMAPMPGRVTVVGKNTNPGVDDDPLTPGIQEFFEASEIDVDRTDVYPAGHPLAGQLKNPGYPFWIAGVDCGGPAGLADPTGCRDGIVGQRATTPPMDMITKAEAAALAGTDALWSHPGFAAAGGGFDGGLPRHSLEGFAAVDDPAVPGLRDPAVVEQIQTRFDFRKVVHKAKPVYFPEQGTDVEQAAMRFHKELHHATFLPDGSAGQFRTNGAPPVPGAPYQEPCIDDQGDLFIGSGEFFGATAGSFYTATPGFDATDPRVYKAANVQLDAVFNKVGYHFPQQRIISLWNDVMPFFNKQKPPEPFVIRMNTFDCTQYYHSNLVPNEYELDDFQVRTPTDVIGQHIHLPKWDLTTADGSGNGWNYEDGTLSPGAVIERIEAINHFNDPLVNPNPVPTLPKPDGNGGGLTQLAPATNPDPDYPAHPDALGARTTMQRWFADPVVNVDLVDRGLGIIFTHDHFGPSTHQQVGLYATVLTEPAGSIWKHNETGVQLATRTDGGPTSWQAIITDFPKGSAGQPAADAKPFREFYFEFADFQHAYEANVAGIMPDAIPDAQMFRNAISPSVRVAAPFPDNFVVSNLCPGGVPRPCPEAISAADVGMYVVNYRNEPIGLRVYDPAAIGPDGKPGTQTLPTDRNGDGIIDAGEKVAGDLTFAISTEVRDKLGNVTPIPRAIPQMNLDPQTADLQFWGSTLNAGGGLPGDPFTPMLRTYPGDLVRVKIQTGATEEEHNATIHGVKWLQAGSGHGTAPNSGWRNAQEAGISEQFTFSAPINSDVQSIRGPSDYAYSVDASADGWWSGMWGILRNYDTPQPDLATLAGGFDKVPQVVNRDEFAGVCPAANPGAPPGQRVPANLRKYTVIAIAANELLDNPLAATIPPNVAPLDNVGGPLDPAGGTLVYNPRTTQAAFLGPLHDPTALLYVNANDLEPLNGFLPNGNPVDAACKDSGGANPTPGVASPKCPVKLKAGVNPEPIVMRAAAGDCIEATLYNRLPAIAPDLAGFTTLIGVTLRDRNDPAGVTTFNNNLIRPSSYAGLHPQLVEYDVTRADGSCVGINVCGDGDNIVAPPDATGKLARAVTYRWYAGDLSYVPEGSGVRAIATPVEFGGSNLIPADKVKQGQKAMVGALIVEPQGSTWTEDPGLRAAATVTAGATQFRDFAVIFQKFLPFRYGDGTAVENMTEEEGEAEDAGQMGINFGSEPAWFRFGLRASTPFGNGPGQLGAVPNSHEFYSNALAGGDPATPVFTATAGQQTRMRVLMPTGSVRGSTFDLEGHVWQRDPYLTAGFFGGEVPAGSMPSQTIGINPFAWYLGGQESVMPAAHFEVFLPSAGGAFGVTGDYLFRDHASLGNSQGMWGILRVQP